MCCFVSMEKEKFPFNISQPSSSSHDPYIKRSGACSLKQLNARRICDTQDEDSSHVGQAVQTSVFTESMIHAIT